MSSFRENSTASPIWVVQVGLSFVFICNVSRYDQVYMWKIGVSPSVAKSATATIGLILSQALTSLQSSPLALYLAAANSLASTF